jgi:metacaspase-1
MTAKATKALCVGIDEFVNLPQGNWLQGCVNDAEDVAKWLGEQPGWKDAEITVLRDAKATKKAILAALTGMLTEPGIEHVVFTMSSHGTQVPNTDGDDEVDGVDEAFACYDIKAAGDDWDRATVIVDDEFRELFAKVDKSVLVEVVLDTCHSGDGLRSLDLIPGRLPRFLPPPTVAGMRRIEAAAEPNRLRELVKSLPTATRPVLFAACRSNQVSSDAHFEGRANGAFTYYFLKALDDDKTSRAKVVAQVNAALQKGDFEQVPQLEAPAQAKKVPFGSRW